jgi:hypothetical protein
MNTKQHVALLLLLLLLLLFVIYEVNLQLHTWNKSCLQRIQCCSYSVATIHGAYNAIYIVKSIVLLHQYFPQYLCSAKYGCFL